MRAVKDRQAVGLLFQVTPVRVGPGNVSAQRELFSVFANDERKMRGEWTVVGAGDEDRERIRAHEGKSIGVIANAEVFGDVHSFFSPPADSNLFPTEDTDIPVFHCELCGYCFRSSFLRM
jgi:hypothetical protein